jgi:hypothetical protein
MYLKTPDGLSAIVVEGSTPADHDGWMWDLTVPGNNDHDFYVAAVQQLGYDVFYTVPADAALVLVHNSDEGLTPEQLKSIQSYENLIAEHQQKLGDYLENPDAYDNKGFLENAPTDAIRQQIIDGRVNHLQQEIKTFQDNIAKIREAGGCG